MRLNGGKTENSFGGKVGKGGR